MELIFVHGLGTTEILVLLVIGLLPLLFFLWALVEVLTSDFKDSITKIIWLLVILLVPFIGFLLYFIIGRSQRIKQSSSPTLPL